MSVKEENMLHSEVVALEDLRNCLYHSRQFRGGYQALLNSTTTIRVRQLRVLGRLVCLCNTKGDYLDDIIKTKGSEFDEKRFPSLTSHLNSIQTTSHCYEARGDLSERYKLFLHQAAENKSVARFLTLLDEALRGIFYLFKEDTALNPPKPKTTKSAKGEDGRKQTNALTEFDVKEAWPELRNSDEEVDMDKHRVAARGAGPGLRKGEVVTEVYTSSPSSRRTQGQTLRYFLPGRKYVNIKRMKWYPEPIVKPLGADRARLPKRCYQADELQIENDKECRQNTYRRRKNNRPLSDKPDRSSTEEDDSVRCRTCLQSYRPCDRKQPCLHHPDGLLYSKGLHGGKWACCGEPFYGPKNKVSMTKSHQSTGCVSSYHVWKRAKGSTKKISWKDVEHVMRLRF